MAAGFMITPTTVNVHRPWCHSERGPPSGEPAVENNASDVLGCQVTISEIDGRT